MTEALNKHEHEPRPRAVVFAYHNVGVRCLKVLLAGGVDVALVVTHEDSATRTSGSNPSSACARPRASLHHAARRQIAGIAGAGAGGRPDFIFSFYYRHMLPASLLAVAPAFNMHGSLLPEYRGRAPVNWAVLHGATETGATLHEMTVKPDAGAIVSQMVVPILPDDTAFEVFGKVTVAAEQALWRVRCSMARRRACTTTSARAAISAGASPKMAASTGTPAQQV
jgi:methionyl-tRNA formyltransferase